MKLNTNGLNYHVEVYGKGTPIVLLHGFTGSIENWSTIINGLEAHAAVIAIDLPGHGQTESPEDIERYRIASVARDVVAICDVLKIAEFVLWGYSMGGRLALFMTVHYPERVKALMLESSSPGLATRSEREARIASDEKLAQRIEHDGIVAFVDFWESLALWDSQKQLPVSVTDELRTLRLKNHPRGLANSLRGMGTGVQPSLWDELHALTLPVSILVGELDQKFVKIGAEMQERLPESTYLVIKNAGHTLHLEMPDAMIRYCLELLTQVD